MKEIVKYEMYKTLKRPIVIIVAIILIVFNFWNIIFGSFYNEPTYGMGYDKERVNQLQQEQVEFEGYINEQWIQNIQKEKESILNDQDNQISQDEREKKIKELLERGFALEVIEENPIFFIKEEVLYSRELQRLEEPEVASNFYHYASAYGTDKGAYYRENYEGAKGEALALKAEEMFDFLSNEHTVYYAYSWGWSRVLAIQTLLPFTIGIFLIVALSPIFSSEYKKNTDSILLSSKYGKNKLIRGKIMSAFSIAISVWLGMQILNAVVTFSLFGMTGWKSFVQNWAVNPSPYTFNYLTNYLMVVAFSFTGLLFLTSLILLVSSRSKGAFGALLISGFLTLVPSQLSFSRGIIERIRLLFPSNVLIGVDYFKNFDGVYMFDRVIMFPVVVIVFSIMVTMLMLIGSYRGFSKRQVKH
ncbi:ABC-2 family transporter [Natranaerovirga hydrolytica]|uniref:ABC-2 family transporter n=1 Tax=Natranaerovirga hydrolytica TaxID=680378 RepID=A0A4R1MPF2_9FIRM|nr:ABC transporter permease subunit [Natranaerovirga hydrolytica]TCK93184.1 ABC-2 family transporter [Natranaerovirga hydrolytica]